MKLFDITLKNFRNFTEYQVSLGRNVTVFIGRNGMGKTNLIAGMVQSLSFIFSKQRDTMQYEFIRSTDQSVKSFKTTDPRYFNRDYTYPISIEATGGILTEDHIIPLSWTFEQESRKSGLKDSRFREAYHTFWNYYNTLGEKPVFAFFSDGFPHKDTNISSGMKAKLKTGNPLPAGDGYYQWDKEQSCVNIWKKYYIQQWMGNKLSPNAEKAAFVAAINEKLCEFSSPINNEERLTDISISELTVDYRGDEATLLVAFSNGTVRNFDTLPAGYNRIFSIVLDLASRSLLLNHNTNSQGIVFIDELDLHLHPSLEAEILQRLQRSFPRIQFIVSTHSPMIISNFDQSIGQEDDFRLINLLCNEDEYYNATIENVFGLDYNSSVENVMGTRMQSKYEDDLVEAYQYWKDRDYSKADKIAQMLLEKYSSDSSIIRRLGL